MSEREERGVRNDSANICRECVRLMGCEGRAEASTTNKPGTGEH